MHRRRCKWSPVLRCGRTPWPNAPFVGRCAPMVVRGKVRSASELLPHGPEMHQRSANGSSRDARSRGDGGVRGARKSHSGNFFACRHSVTSNGERAALSRPPAHRCLGPLSSPRRLGRHRFVSTALADEEDNDEGVLHPSVLHPSWAATMPATIARSRARPMPPKPGAGTREQAASL